MTTSTSAKPREQIEADDAITTDRLLGGRIVLQQFRKGHRVGTDAVLLAAGVEIPLAGTVIDAGAGVGAIGIILALRSSNAKVVLLENDPATAALARTNIRLNDMESRLAVVEADLFDSGARRAARFGSAGAALVVTNPPYYIPTHSQVSPNARRARAHTMAQSTTNDHSSTAGWLRACLDLLAPRGTLALIHRPEALPTILVALQQRAGNVRITPILPRADANATRILVTAVKASRAAAGITAPLVLHGPDGRFTAKVEAAHRGC